MFVMDSWTKYKLPRAYEKIRDFKSINGEVRVLRSIQPKYCPSFDSELDR